MLVFSYFSTQYRCRLKMHIIVQQNKISYFSLCFLLIIRRNIYCQLTLVNQISINIMVFREFNKIGRIKLNNRNNTIYTMAQAHSTPASIEPSSILVVLYELVLSSIVSISYKWLLTFNYKLIKNKQHLKLSFLKQLQPHLSV